MTEGHGSTVRAAVGMKLLQLTKNATGLSLCPPPQLSLGQVTSGRPLDILLQVHTAGGPPMMHSFIPRVDVWFPSILVFVSHTSASSRCYKKLQELWTAANINKTNLMTSLALARHVLIFF